MFTNNNNYYDFLFAYKPPTVYTTQFQRRSATINYAELRNDVIVPTGKMAPTAFWGQVEVARVP